MNKKVISFHYTLKDSAFQTLDSSEGGEPLTFLEGSGQMIPFLEKALNKLGVGEKKTVEIKSEQAFGAHDPKKIKDVPLAQMPKKDIKVGERFQTDDHSAPLTATKITPTHVTLDGNHPLAGKDLVFDVQITEVRDATKEEVEHGHAHGPGGHHHH